MANQPLPPQENHKTKLSCSSFPINSTRCPVTASLEPSSLPQETGLSCTIGFLAGCTYITLLMVGKVQNSIELGQSRQNSPLPLSFLFFFSLLPVSWRPHELQKAGDLFVFIQRQSSALGICFCEIRNHSSNHQEKVRVRSICWCLCRVYSSRSMIHLFFEK